VARIGTGCAKAADIRTLVTNAVAMRARCGAIDPQRDTSGPPGATERRNDRQRRLKQDASDVCEVVAKITMSPDPSGNCRQPSCRLIVENFYALSGLNMGSCAGNRTAGDIGRRAGGRFQ
jgi:hypothetical protein